MASAVNKGYQQPVVLPTLGNDVLDKPGKMFSNCSRTVLVYQWLEVQCHLTLLQNIPPVQLEHNRARCFTHSRAHPDRLIDSPGGRCSDCSG